MFLVLKRHWAVFDGGASGHEKRHVKIEPGRHEIERIPNPNGEGCWLVLKGTKIGQAEVVWRSFAQHGRGEMEVIIEEGPQEEIGSVTE